MESIVFFGKGGIGKSTIATNVSLLLAAGGRKVLHVGCDPKRDSTLSLTGRRIRPFSDQGGGADALDGAVHKGVKGVDCIEAGGPQAGVGCAGAGIGALLDAIKSAGLVEKNGYDIVVFDVLGDVVCGGFAAPLRRGFASKAVLVVSEEVLSLYAANNLMAMVNNYARNGVYLAGLAVNARELSAVGLAEDFARAAGTRVLGIVPRDPAVARAEKARRTVAAMDPRSAAARSLARLATAIAAAPRPAAPPRPLGESEFEDFISGRPRRAAAPPPRKAGGREPSPSPAALLESSGFSVTGLLGEQALCSWKGRGETVKIFIASASDPKPGMRTVGDWAFCFAPDSAPGSAGFDGAIRGISGLSYKAIVDSFGGGRDFYGDKASFGRSASDPLQPDDGRLVDPYTGFDQWHRFIFSDGPGICIPPGAVMVEHGDKECRFSSCPATPLGTFRKTGGLSSELRPSPAPLLPKESSAILNTDLSREDAVGGDGAKIAAGFAAAAARAGKGGLVEFYSGCPALVQAGDTAAFGAEAARDLGVEVLRDKSNSFDEETPDKVRARAALVVRRLAARRRGRTAADVNLIDFAASKAAPLAALLAGRGLAVARAGRDFYGAIATTRLQVLSRPDPVLIRAFDEAGVKWAAPPAPYGLAATREWLRALFAALGARAPGEGFGPSKAEAAGHAALAKKLSRYAAGFVASPEELGALDSPRAFSGVPFLRVLAEAGAPLRLLCHAPGAAARARAKKEAAGLAARTGTRPRLACFDNPAGLSKALTADRALRLVYSDIPLDPRLAAAGKCAFSASVCEPGYAGALETLRRLAQLCEWDFNERYFR